MKNYLIPCGALLVAAPSLLAQSVEQRLQQLEQQNRTLRQQVDALSSDVERIDLGGLVPPLSDAKRGVGQGAAKVYDVEQGLSIGGYGEFLFQATQWSARPGRRPAGHRLRRLQVRRPVGVPRLGN